MGMVQDQMQSLLEKAGDLYNQGRYDKAIEAWNEVLRADPANKKANEGIRMASLLMSHDAEELAAISPPSEDGDSFRDRIEAIMFRVRDLVAEGNYADAIDGCTLLEDLAAGDPDVERLCAEVRAAVPADPQPTPVRSPGARPATQGGDIESLLIAARRALERGDEAEAARAAGSALAQDPACMEAIGILSMTGHAPPRVLQSDRNLEALSVDEAIAVDDLLDDANEPVAIPSLDEDTSPAIKDLIMEGQHAFNQGRMQEAIGVWSRIFALDADNQMAGDLIDRARRHIENDVEKVDQIFQRGLDAREAGRLEEARELFHKVRSLSPMHAEAAVAIEEVDAKLAGEAVAIGLDSHAVEEADIERSAAFASDSAAFASYGDVFQDESEPGINRGSGRTTTAVPHAVEKPRDGRPAASAKPALAGSQSAEAGGSNARLRLILGGVGALVVVGAAYFAWTSFGKDTGISEAEATTLQTSAGRPAPSTNGAGGGTGAAAATGEQETPAASPEEMKEKARQHAQAGWDYYQKGDWAAAVKELREARKTDPLFSMQDTLDNALRNLEAQAEFETEMAAATKYFGEGDYGSSLHKLYRLQEKFPRRAPFDKWIAAAWFNWGALLMDAGAIDEAVEKFNEALEINSFDAGARRAREVAMRYQERPRDPAFDTFVQSLEVRKLEQP